MWQRISNPLNPTQKIKFCVVFFFHLYSYLSNEWTNNNFICILFPKTERKIIYSENNNLLEKCTFSSMIKYFVSKCNNLLKIVKKIYIIWSVNQKNTYKRYYYKHNFIRIAYYKLSFSLQL